jgi:hypothetical protein
MRGLNTRWRDLGRHGLDALARSRQEKASAVGLQRRDPIRMVKGPRQSLKVGSKARLVGQRGVQKIHASLCHEIESPTIHPYFMTQ